MTLMMTLTFYFVTKSEYLSSTLGKFRNIEINIVYCKIAQFIAMLFQGPYRPASPPVLKWSTFRCKHFSSITADMQVVAWICTSTEKRKLQEL